MISQAGSEMVLLPEVDRIFQASFSDAKTGIQLAKQVWESPPKSAMAVPAPA